MENGGGNGLLKNVNGAEGLNTRQQTDVWAQFSAAVGNETHAENVD